MKKTTIKLDQQGHINTLINHGSDCCGCLYGIAKKDLIDFICNECGEHAGYISLNK